ncbi:hypothetical protein [Chryseobacterium indoltheticum]|uniref:Lipocalin-like domain-containing protein n=1 Tax=Chryseobacterium indoltheticum TaxID=254 RepID=A0A381FGH6_9FLAO|nr:hypothetical protein [Chryseobacterium indoltheticum]SIQ09015.1 hypothetical protein SAMN05421682_102310 [Chryseobacterium indoltheticum]SUX45583.1 Uncharacterised protein [Chryseobacterium indoltheticum]
MKFYLLILCTLFLSCSEVKQKEPITSQWEFISINEGEKYEVDAKMLNNINKENGTGTLEFKDNLSFSSLGGKNKSAGTYTLKNNTLVMQYSNLPEPIKFNYSVVDKKYLLLRNIDGKKLTWLYKKSK